MKISFASIKRVFLATLIGTVASGVSSQSLSQTTFSHFENLTDVATLTATGTTGTLSWAVSGTDGSLFSINSSTGALAFASAPDYENPTDNDVNNVYAITIDLTDGNGTTSHSVSVTVTNTFELANECPTITKKNNGSIKSGPYVWTYAQDNLLYSTGSGSLEMQFPAGTPHWDIPNITAYYTKGIKTWTSDFDHPLVLASTGFDSSASQKVYYNFFSSSGSSNLGNNNILTLEFSDSVFASRASRKTYSRLCGYDLSGSSPTAIPVPNIITPYLPDSLSDCAGANRTIQVYATVGTTGNTLAYQWYKNGALIAGSIYDTLQLTNVNTSSVGTYYCIVAEVDTNSDTLVCNSSNDCVYTLLTSPSVSISPASATIVSGYSASLTASGANSYAWSPVAGLSATSGASVTASPTTTTTYTVTGTGSNGCTASATVVVTVTPALSVSAGIAFNNVCNGASAGSISVYPAGGAVSYSYLAIDPNNNSLTASSSSNDSAVFSSLAAGAYQIIVTDNNSDTASVWMTISQPSVLGGTSSNTNVSCNGGSDGLAIISGTGGVSPYSYKIGSGTYQTNDSFGTLSAGQYLITIVDQNICTDTFSIYITEPTALSISKTVQTNLTCAADSNGSVTLAATGGTTPYQFTVDSLNFQSSGTFTGLSKQSYTSYVIDANGCSQTLAFTITHLDNVNPTASARNNTVYLSAAGAATLVVDSIDNGSSDNCGIQSKAADITSFSCADLGVNLVVLTVTDLDGNTDTAHAYVTVADTIYPQVTGLASINSYLNANGEDTIHVNDVVTSLSDNCGVASYYISDSTFTCSDTGANMVQIIVVDGSGNTTAIDLVVNVYDTLAPTVLANNQVLYLDANGAASLTLADVNNGSYDNCGIADMWMTDSTFNCADTGTSTIQLYATDAAGNSSFANVNVTVYDTLAPVILAKSITVYLDAAGTASISVSGIDTGSYDNCGIDSQYLSKTNFTCTDTGSNSVTYTVKDAAGNTSTASLSIQVIDSILPTLSVQNLVLYLDSFGKAYTHVDSADNGTFDNCGIASLTLSQDTFDCSHVGDNTITFTATDKNNNQNSTTLTITVYDTLAPTLLLQQDTVYLDTAADAFIVDTDIIAYSYDNCGIDSVLISQTEFGLSDTNVVTVWVTLKDKNGNQTGPDSVLVYVMISDSDSDGIMDYLEGGGDNDGDGVKDYLDLDSDNDGLLDFVENDFQDFKVDSDVDGTPDYLDLDSDGDGIFDVFETDGVDGDVDGVVGVGMPLVNSQGVPDSADNGLGYTPVDTDNDGIYDFKDLDTDDDGISDATERGATAIPVDSDGDGVRDWRDTDSDNDGIADATEGSVDSDGDGVGDWRDTDSDDDGIADSIEGTTDTDGDGTPDYLDLDSDNDGISDQIETNLDTDGDGTGDWRDTDSDNDGILDSTEGTVDTDGDGTGDWRDTDSDNDGISDAIEGTVDTDGDGTGDWRDTDSDNDGISDAIEGTVDTDGDGTGDWRDTDSDNDGISDATEGTVDTDGDGTGDWRDTDSDNDGISDATEGTVDTDGDGTGDWRDTDSDNDGISDATEGTVDTDGDGTGDWRDLDSDNDGIDDATEGTTDTDGDGKGDWRDTDSDDDGILDSIEGTTDTDGDGTGDWRDTDSDDDGIDDSIEGTTDTDGDGTGDWRDRDSDDDGIDDAIEGTTDTDGDGTGDWRDTDSDNDGIDDATEGTTDTDGDGTGDWRDTDSDNDGIDDATEGTTDTDGDGTGDWRDLDSDADGIDDATEGTTDTDGDGTGDWRDLDSDDDGIDDATEGTTDTDGDGTGDWRDTDSDNDGIDDSIEGTTDTDGDGVGDWRDTDSDNDGIDDATEGTTDTDGDGTGDWRDTDSDNDGIDDATEGTTDTDGDGIGNWRDTDSDNDEVDDATEGTADRDKNGIPDYIDAQVFIPEGFSPNGDGDNDIFYIKGLRNYTQAEFMVFNRWGQIVFESGRGYNNQWDAKYRGNIPTLRAGETLPEDVYFFVFRYNGNDGKKDVSGNIYIKP